MSITVTSVQGERVPGAERRTVNKVKLGSKYATGGIEVTPAKLGLKKVTFAHCDLVKGSEESEKWVHGPYYNPSTKKVELHDAKTGKELAAEVETTKVEVQIIAYGK
jgi:hypothetical protein